MEGAPQYHNIKPRTRTEREGMRDREAVEKLRLKERSGGYHQYEEFKGVTRPDPSSNIYLPEAERFDRDFAAEERRRIEQEQQRRQQALANKREQMISREVQRWQMMEEQERREQARIEEKKAKFQAGMKNNPSAAFNPITLEYDSTEQGSKLKQQDDYVKYRADMRMKNLDSKMNSGYNILTGEPRRTRNVPNPPY